jgi:AraC-like DNA-binding protein
MKKNNRIDIDSDALKFPFVQLIGYDSILTPITLPPHFHGGYEIVFLEKGDTVFELPNNNIINIRGGNFSIIHPGTIHRGEWEIIKPCTLFWIIFDFSSPNTANGFLDQNFLKKIDMTFRNAGSTVFKGTEQLRKQFKRLLAIMIRYTADCRDETAIALLQIQLLHILVTLYESLTHQLPESKDHLLPIEKIDSYIRNNIDEKFEIQKLAEICCLSVSVFQYQFKLQTGLSPGDYITRFRVEKAKKLLTNPDCSMISLAMDLGFSSSQYFSTIFKKYTGMSPTDFRKKSALK